MQQFLGVDIGGTHTRLIIMDSQQQFSGYHKVKTADWAQQPQPLQGLAELIGAALPALGDTRVMLGLPGILSRDRARVLSLPFIPALDNQPVAAQLAQALGVEVRMDKDVNHLMWWDLTRLPQLPRVAAGVYLGTGMGNSLWLDGAFYHGAHGAAGELGHIPWPGLETACRCGKRGCVESVTAGHWLAAWAAARAPETAIGALFATLGEHPDLQAFITRLAQAIATEMNIFDPEHLVLGGGVLAMPGFPQASLVAQIRAHLRAPQPAAGLAITFSDVTDETGCRGACLAAARDLAFSGSRRQA